MDVSKLANATSAAGPSLLEMLWDELDRVMSRLMSESKPKTDARAYTTRKGLDYEKYSADWQHWGETRGQAQGLAFAIATIESPYDSDVPYVKERAMERWEAKQ